MTTINAPELGRVLNVLNPKKGIIVQTGKVRQLGTSSYHEYDLNADLPDFALRAEDAQVLARILGNLEYLGTEATLKVTDKYFVVNYAQIELKMPLAHSTAASQDLDEILLHPAMTYPNTVRMHNPNLFRNVLENLTEEPDKVQVMINYFADGTLVFSGVSGTTSFSIPIPVKAVGDSLPEKSWSGVFRMDALQIALTPVLRLYDFTNSYELSFQDTKVNTFTPLVLAEKGRSARDPEVEHNGLVSVLAPVFT